MLTKERKIKGASRPQISFSAAPIAGPVTNPEVSMAANLPKRSPAREGSTLATTARAAGMNAPNPSPVKARAAINSQTEEAIANQMVPKAAAMTAPTSRDFVLPRSANGANHNWPIKPAKNEAPAIRPKALFANPNSS